MRRHGPGASARATRRRGGCSRRHDPTYYFATRRLPAELRPATHALYGYVRTADQIVDGPRRPATPDAAPRGARRLGGASSRRRASTPARSSARSPTPPPATRSRSASCAPTCARCGSTARRCGSPAGRSCVAYMDGSAGSVGRIMAALLGVPARHHADLGRLGLAFQLANFIRDVPRGPAPGPHLPARRGPRALRRERGTTSPPSTPRPSVRALLAHEVERARGLFAGARPAIAAAPASVRPGVPLRRSALYGRMLDRVEAAASTSSAAAPASASGTCPGAGARGACG